MPGWAGGCQHGGKQPARPTPRQDRGQPAVAAPLQAGPASWARASALSTAQKPGSQSRGCRRVVLIGAAWRAPARGPRSGASRWNALCGGRGGTGGTSASGQTRGPFAETPGLLTRVAGTGTGGHHAGGAGSAIWDTSVFHLKSHIVPPRPMPLLFPLPFPAVSRPRITVGPRGEDSDPGLLTPSPVPLEPCPSTSGTGGKGQPASQSTLRRQHAPPGVLPRPPWLAPPPRRACPGGLEGPGVRHGLSIKAGHWHSAGSVCSPLLLAIV